MPAEYNYYPQCLKTVWQHAVIVYQWLRQASVFSKMQHYTNLLEGATQTNCTLLEGKHSSDGCWIWQPVCLARLVVCVCVSAQSWQHYTRSPVTVFFNICPLGEWPTRLPHRGIQYTLQRGKMPLLCPTTETAVLIYHVCYAAFETPAIFPSKHHRGGH